MLKTKWGSDIGSKAVLPEYPRPQFRRESFINLNGSWEYARFNPDGSRHGGPVEACFTCHLEKRAGQDFVFNLWDYVQGRKP